MTRPAFLSRGYWSAKRAAILIGFILAALGMLGPQFYVGPVEDLGAEADLAAKRATTHIETLRSAQSQYLLFEQLGALIYAINATGTIADGGSQNHTLQDLYQLALVDRSTQMKLIIGEVAKAQVLDFATTAAAYNDLVATARKTVSLDSYKAVDNFENKIMDQANALMVNMQQALLADESAKSAYEGAATRRRFHMLIMTAFGSMLLLAANLMSEKPKEPERPEPETEAEAATAERI